MQSNSESFNYFQREEAITNFIKNNTHRFLTGNKTVRLMISIYNKPYFLPVNIN